MAITLFIFFAGFLAGTTAVLIYALYREQLFTRKFDTERMKLTNKAFIREGSIPLFSAEDISGPDAEPITPAVTAARTVVSPFHRGKQKVRESLEEQRKQEAGSKLPDELKSKIALAAEAARNNAAA